jgi:hypothetical protein
MAIAFSGLKKLPYFSPPPEVVGLEQLLLLIAVYSPPSVSHSMRPDLMGSESRRREVTRSDPAEPIEMLLLLRRGTALRHRATFLGEWRNHITPSRKGRTRGLTKVRGIPPPTSNTRSTGLSRAETFVPCSVAVVAEEYRQIFSSRKSTSASPDRAPRFLFLIPE